MFVCDSMKNKVYQYQYQKLAHILVRDLVLSLYCLPHDENINPLKQN